MTPEVFCTLSQGVNHAIVCLVNQGNPDKRSLFGCACASPDTVEKEQMVGGKEDEEAELRFLPHFTINLLGCSMKVARQRFCPELIFCVEPLQKLKGYCLYHFSDLVCSMMWACLESVAMKHKAY